MSSSATADATHVYLGYTQDALDQAYTQSHWAANMDRILQGWAEKSASVRTSVPGYREHAYGKTACERIDVFNAGGPIVHVHLHGGAWQRQAKEGCSFMAPAMRAVNAPFVVPEFGKLPAFRMPEVFDQIVRAIVWTYRTLVVDQGKAGIVVSGHSSGAHMAARIASHDFGDEMPASTLRAVLCVSGAYDLEPVMLSARRIYIDLSEREQRFMSPIARISETKVPVHLFYGSEESPEFKRQSIAYADALRGQGKLACCTEIAGANHFEIASQMAQSDQTVGRAVAGLLSEESRKTAK